MIFVKNNSAEINSNYFDISTSLTDSRILLVPTKRRMRALTKETVKKSKNSSTGKIFIFTFELFFNSILKIINPNYRHLKDAVGQVLLEKIIRDNKKELHFFKNDIPSGTLLRLKNVIAEYKKHNYSPQSLREEIVRKKSEGINSLKFLDISTIYEKYNEEVKKLNAKEIGDVYFDLLQTPIDIIYSAFKAEFPTINEIVIDEFDNFILPEIKLIEKLTELPDINVVLSFDFPLDNKGATLHLQKTVEHLDSIKNFSVINKNTDSFQSRSEKNEEKNVRVIEAQSKQKEVEFIAKEIKELILRENVKPSDICVAFNLADRYSSIISTNFAAYDIPFNLTDRKLLSSCLPVIALSNFLEIKNSDYYFKSINRALSTGFITIKNFDLFNLMRVANELNIVSGYENWSSKLKNYDEQKRKQYSRVNQYSVNKAFLDIKKLNSLFKVFENDLSIDEFKKSLIDLISKLNLTENILSDKNVDIEENVRGLEKFISASTELFDLLKGTTQKEKNPSSYYFSILKTLIKKERFNIKEKINSGVQVTNLSELRGFNYDYLFIGGLIDGEFPTKFNPEIFFTDTFLKKDDEHISEQLFHFHNSISSVRKTLYLSYPTRDSKSENEKSIFLKNYLENINYKVKTEADYTNKLYSKYEIQKKYFLLSEENQKKLKIDFSELLGSQKIDELRFTSPFAETEYTGFLNNFDENVEIKNLLNAISAKNIDADSTRSAFKEYFNERHYSASQLETLANCPYKFFAEKILRPNFIEDPSEDIEANEFGTLIHEILKRYYQSIKEEKIDLIKTSADDLIKRIFTIAEKAISDFNLTSPLAFYDREKILGISGVKSDSILYRFVLNEKEELKSGFFPFLLEQEFNSKELNIHELIGVELKGTIDRIDVNHENKTYRVIDYKTGSSDFTKAEVENGLALQLPLYSFVTKFILKNNFGLDYEFQGAYIYSLKYNSEYFKLDDKKIDSAIIKNSVECVKKFVSSANEGKFNSQQKGRKKFCKYCEYFYLCRIKEIES